MPFDEARLSGLRVSICAQAILPTFVGRCGWTRCQRSPICLSRRGAIKDALATSKAASAASPRGTAAMGEARHTSRAALRPTGLYYVDISLLGCRGGARVLCVRRGQREHKHSILWWLRCCKFLRVQVEGPESSHAIHTDQSPSLFWCGVYVFKRLSGVLHLELRCTEWTLPRGRRKIQNINHHRRHLDSPQSLTQSGS